MWLTDAGHDYYWLDNWRPSQGTPANIRTNIIFLETSIIDLHFAADTVCLSSFKFFWQAPKEYFISGSDVSVVQGHPRSWFWCQSKARIWLPIRPSVTLVLSCTVSEILQVFCAPDPTPILPQFWGCSRCTRWPMLGSARAEALSYSAVKLFSKNSNLCDHGT